MCDLSLARPVLFFIFLWMALDLFSTKQKKRHRGIVVLWRAPAIICEVSSRAGSARCHYVSCDRYSELLNTISTQVRLTSLRCAIKMFRVILNSQFQWKNVRFEGWLLGYAYNGYQFVWTDRITPSNRT